MLKRTFSTPALISRYGSFSSQKGQRHLLALLAEKNSQLEEARKQLERRVRDLNVLFTIEAAMARATSLTELFGSVLAEARHACDAEAAAFAVNDPDALAWFAYVMNDKDKFPRSFPLSGKKDLLELALVKRDIVQMKAKSATKSGVTRPQKSPTGPPSIRAHKSRDLSSTDMVLQKTSFFRNGVAISLDREEGEPLGAFALYNKKGRPSFSADDKSMIRMIAANVSTALKLHQARDLREKEERLTEIGRLLSGIIHDLKTPLSVILGYVDLLKETDVRSVRDVYSDRIRAQFDFIMNMQKDLLLFAKGQRVLLRRKVFLHSFFREIQEQWRPNFEKADLDFEVKLVESGAAKFDGQKIMRVISNLARNALEALTALRQSSPVLPRTKRLYFRITVSRTKKDLVMKFKDNGPGIPKNILPRLFGSFVTSGKKDGTGIGLAVVKRIAEEHGGIISVRSGDRGTEFVLRLPQ